MSQTKEQIELDLGEEATVEITANKEQDNEVEPVVEQEDNFEKANSATQNRIDELTRKIKYAERDKDEAVRFAQQVQQESTELKQRLDNLDNSYVDEFSNRVETQLASAETEMTRAMEMGDTKAMVEAQRKLTQLAIENDRAQQAKIYQERQKKEQPQAEVQQPQQPVRQAPDPKAQQWAQRNTWFGADGQEPKTYAAFGIHKKLVEEGFDPQTDEYYSKLDERLEEVFPTVNGGSNRPAQTVASVSRSSGRSSTSSTKKVRLTPSQVAIARKLGVPLEEYAKYVKE